MKAVKGNKTYDINEAQRKKYLAEGFDIYDEEGGVLEYSPLKKVSFNEYVKLQKENEALKAQIEELRKENEDTSASGAKKKKAGA